MTTPSIPIELDFKSAKSGAATKPVGIKTFTSYAFERNILIPAAPFRFTAPGIDKTLRTSIRSGDLASIWIRNLNGKRIQLGTGFIDETDTHVTESNVEYLLTGRDTMSQLIDNAAVDKDNKIINQENLRIDQILGLLIENTRIPSGYVNQNCPTGTFLFHTNAGETKINALQRYMEYANCLVWSKPNGQLIIGKPKFAQAQSGKLQISPKTPSGNNLLEARVRRNTNLAIRQIVVQLQGMGQVDSGVFTKLNNDKDVKALAKSMVGRSVYQFFSYGSGSDAANFIAHVGNQSGTPNAIGSAMAGREIAKDNVKVLEVECVVSGHLNENNVPYNVDQIYYVKIDDDNVNEQMYVYSCSWELTEEHGMLTRLKLCRVGTTIVDGAWVLQAAGPSI